MEIKLEKGVYRELMRAESFGVCERVAPKYGLKIDFCATEGGLLPYHPLTNSITGRVPDGYVLAVLIDGHREIDWAGFRKEFELLDIRDAFASFFAGIAQNRASSLTGK